MDQEGVAGILMELVEGERAWFWWSGEAQAPASGLLIQPLASDPSMARIRDDIAAAAVRPGARAISGLLQVEGGGRLALVSRQARRGDLEALAGWVRAQHGMAPGLSRLRDASLRQIDEDGEITEVFEEPALWQGVPRLLETSEAERAAEVLRGLEEGEQAWFWMTASGPDGKAALLMVPTGEDEGGERFSARVQALRRRGARSEGALQGIARRQGDILALMTTVPAKTWADTVAALLGQGGRPFRRLRRARLVYLKDGAAKKEQDLPAWRDLCETVDVLEAGEGGWFWFSPAAAHGQPLLLLRPDRDVLKEAAAAIEGEGPAYRGRLVVGPDDNLTLQIREAGADFRPVLLQWARAESERWPALRRLRGVQLDNRA